MKWSLALPRAQAALDSVISLPLHLCIPFGALCLLRGSFFLTARRILDRNRYVPKSVCNSAYTTILNIHVDVLRGLAPSLPSESTLLRIGSEESAKSLLVCRKGLTCDQISRCGLQIDHAPSWIVIEVQMIRSGVCNVAFYHIISMSTVEFIGSEHKRLVYLRPTLIFQIA